METLDFRKQYEAMTNEELLNLAMDSEQLNPEARNSLDSELSRRGIGRGKIHEYSQDRERFANHRLITGRRNGEGWDSSQVMDLPLVGQPIG